MSGKPNTLQGSMQTAPPSEQQVACPHCGGVVQYEAGWGGHIVSCPYANCGLEFVMPASLPDYSGAGKQVSVSQTQTADAASEFFIDTTRTDHSASKSPTLRKAMAKEATDVGSLLLQGIVGVLIVGVVGGTLRYIGDQAEIGKTQKVNRLQKEYGIVLPKSRDYQLRENVQLTPDPVHGFFDVEVPTGWKMTFSSNRRKRIPANEGSRWVKASRVKLEGKAALIAITSRQTSYHKIDEATMEALKKGPFSLGNLTP